MDINGPLQTRGETRCPGGVSVSCLASRTRHECPRHNKSVYVKAWHWMWTTLYRKCHSHNTPGKRHNDTRVTPLAGNCTASSTRQKEQVWQKCKIQMNWYTVTVAPTIEHHGHSRTPANQRWDQVPGKYNCEVDKGWRGMEGTYLYLAFFMEMVGGRASQRNKIKTLHAKQHGLKSECQWIRPL